MLKPKVSIAVHSGKEEYTPLLENLFKSFLVCNQYPEIELILLETAGNSRVRDWFKNLDFDNFFVNFDGDKTTIEKCPEVKIKKSLMFLDYPQDLPWHTCYMDSLSKAVAASEGEYFCFLAEDNQFVLRGDLFSDYIEILSSLNSSKNMINLSSMQLYKYFKKNNAFLTSDKYRDFFTCENTKWDPTYFCNKEIYNKLGPAALSDISDPHRTVNYYSNRAKLLGFKRHYKKAPAAIWFHNDARPEYIETIIDRTKSDKNFILFKIFQKENFINDVRILDRPVASDDWFPHRN